MDDLSSRTSDQSNNNNNTRELWAELINEGASHLENSLWLEAITTLTSALSIALNGDGAKARRRENTWAKQLRAVVADIPSVNVAPSAFADSSTSNTSNTFGTGIAVARSAAPRTIAEDCPPAAAAAVAASKPKKTRRRRHKRRNSFSSTESRKEVAAPAAASTSRLSSASASRRESRRRTHSNHHLPSSQRRRARSAMGRMTGEKIVTQDILQIPQKYVHPKPLRVMDRFNIPSSMELAIYNVFNLALAYQLQALSEDDNVATARMAVPTVGFPPRTARPENATSSSSSSSVWSRVRKLYHLATDWVDQQQHIMEETADAVVDPNSPLWSPTFTLALPNNLACAYHASGDDVGANVHWQQALSHLWCILDVGCTSQVECFSQIFENAAHVMDGGDSNGASSSMGAHTATAA